MTEEFMAVVLAGGVGSRLFPLTEERPKPLVPIANRPMIDYAIQLLRRAGIKKIVIAVKYLGNQIREWVEKKQNEGYFGGLEIIIPRMDSKDTADAVRKCSKYIDSNFIVTMADIVTNLDVRQAIEFHKKHRPIATICLKPVDQPGQFGLTMIDNDSRIHLFLEKPTPPELYMTTLTFSGKGAILHMHHNLANIGIYVLDKSMLEILQSYGDLMDWGSHVFPFLLDHNMDVRGFLSSDPYWMDCGTIKKYIWANNDVAKKWAYPYLPNEIERSEAIFIGENVEISEKVSLHPPVVIGKNSKIGKNSSVGPNVTIGENSFIGNNVDISDSVLLDNIEIGSNVSLNLCVLSNKVKIRNDLDLIKLVIPSDKNVLKANNEYRWK